MQFREDFALPNFRFSAGAKSIILALKRLQSPYKGLTTALSRNLLPQSTTNEFSYPVSRRKLVLAQIASVWIFNFIALVLSKICFYGTLAAASPYIHIAAENLPLKSGEFYADILAGSAAMVSIGFLALPVGLWMKSSKAAIITGVLIVCFTQGNIGSYYINV